MRTIFVNLKENKGGFASGWVASIGTAHGIKEGNNQIAFGESLIYPTKDTAWTSIRNKVERLDFVQDHIYFNHQHVADHESVLGLVAAL